MKDDKLPKIIDEFELKNYDIEDYDIKPIDINLKGYEDNENIIWKGHPHIISQLSQIFIGSILLIFSVLITVSGIMGSINPLDIFTIHDYYLSIIGIITVIFIFISSYISIKYTRYVLTDQAVYLQKGFI